MSDRYLKRVRGELLRQIQREIWKQRFYIAGEEESDFQKGKFCALDTAIEIIEDVFEHPPLDIERPGDV